MIERREGETGTRRRTQLRDGGLHAAVCARRLLTDPALQQFAAPEAADRVAIALLRHQSKRGTQQFRRHLEAFDADLLTAPGPAAKTRQRLHRLAAITVQPGHKRAHQRKARGLHHGVQRETPQDLVQHAPRADDLDLARGRVRLAEQGRSHIRTQRPERGGPLILDSQNPAGPEALLPQHASQQRRSKHHRRHTEHRTAPRAQQIEKRVDIDLVGHAIDRRRESG